MPLHASNRIRRWSQAAAILGLALAAPSSTAWSQSAGHGPNTDDVTGWRCISPFCDMVIQPRTQCLCRKDNPNETRASAVTLTCLPAAGGAQSCATSSKFTIH